MKGARRRRPRRAERNFKQTLLASALCAALSAHHAYAQDPVVHPPASFDRSMSYPPSRFNGQGRMIRAQQRSAKTQSITDHDPKPAMQAVQQVDATPPARPPRHTVMTADERRLLRQHIEEAVRDLYKR